ncbi:MAG: uL15m family ribosomal protein, partial [Candidatus Sungiibacteriota bacterium]
LGHWKLIIMQIHQLKRTHAQKYARRVGRGGKRGTYSGRGIKGLGARAGGKFRPEERDIIKRIPKLRGYRFPSFQQKPAIVNLDTIERRYAAGDTISPASLVAKGLVVRARGRAPKVKILARGESKKKFIFKNVVFSIAAKTKLKS